MWPIPAHREQEILIKPQPLSLSQPVRRSSQDGVKPDLPDSGIRHPASTCPWQFSFLVLTSSGDGFLLTWEVHLLIIIKSSVSSTSFLGLRVSPSRRAHLSLCRISKTFLEMQNVIESSCEGPATSETGWGTSLFPDSTSMSTPRAGSHCAFPPGQQPRYYLLSPSEAIYIISCMNTQAIWGHLSQRGAWTPVPTSTSVIIQLPSNQLSGENWGLALDWLTSTLLPWDGLGLQDRFFQKADPSEPQVHHFHMATEMPKQSQGFWTWLAPDNFWKAVLLINIFWAPTPHFFYGKAL